MEKDIGKIKKNETTDIIIRIDDFGGRVGLTIREFTTSDRYTGFTKSGTRIPLESFSEFKQMINSIDESEAKTMQGQISETQELPSESAKEDPAQQQLTNSMESSEQNSEKIENSDKIKEEVF